MSKTFYTSPELIASIEVPMVLETANGFVSTVSCWEEPLGVCDFQQ